MSKKGLPAQKSHLEDIQEALQGNCCVSRRIFEASCSDHLVRVQHGRLADGWQAGVACRQEIRSSIPLIFCVFPRPTACKALRIGSRKEAPGQGRTQWSG